MSERQRIIVAGSRSIEDEDLVHSLLTEHFFHSIEEGFVEDVLEVVSGTADGPDQFGLSWAEEHDIPVELFPADWDEYGKSAGPIRNEEMATYADTLVAFWDGESNGTKNMIKAALDYGLELHVYQIRGLDRYP